MAKKLVVPNGIFAGSGLFGNQSQDLTDISDAAFKEELFLESPLSDDELLSMTQERLRQWFTEDSGLFLGSPDFLPISVLLKGRDAGQAVCCLLRQFSDADLDKIIALANQDGRISAIASKLFSDKNGAVDPVKSPDEFKRKAREKAVPCATGFLIGENYLLTNLHVVAEKAHLSEFSAAFKYETALDQKNIFSLDPDFHKPAQNQKLDYVLLKLQSPGIRDQRDINPISLQTVDSVKVIPKPSPGVLANLEKPQDALPAAWENLKSQGLSMDLVNIIQHPEGRPKEVVIFNNQLTELYSDFLVYDTDAQPGSSGSPLFNTQWELIGLHKGAILEDDQVKEYLGIRMSSILADLRQQATDKPDTEIQEFLESIKPKPVLPPTAQQVVFILAGLDRTHILGRDEATLEKEAMVHLQEQVKAELEKLSPGIQIQLIVGTGKKLTEAIQEINQQSQSFPDTRQVAIQLVTDTYEENAKVQGISAYYKGSDPKGKGYAGDAKVQGISAYYNGSDPKGKGYADALLNGIQSKNPSLKIFGAYADQVTRTRRLGFCRQTVIPALVFYAGYLSNPDDRARIEALQARTSDTALAEGIAIGLSAWLKE